MTVTADNALRIAASQLGTVESPPNSNNVHYARWYGMNQNPWCAMFLSWVFSEAGVASQYRHAGVAHSLAVARNRGRHTTEFRRGYVACRINSGGWTGPGHTGVVEAVHADGSVTTIEGNTSPGAGGSQRDGGGVWRRRRSKSYWNRQCIVIKYDDAQPPPATQPPPPATQPGQIPVDGDFGPMTKRSLQVSLNRTGANPQLVVDGDFGSNSKRALQARLNHVAGPVGIDGDIGPQTIRSLQRHVGVAQDGAWGPNTTRALQNKLNSGTF